jgi:hypothetical protein
MSGFSGQIVFERWSIGLYNVVSAFYLLIMVEYFPCVGLKNAILMLNFTSTNAKLVECRL